MTEQKRGGIFVGSRKANTFEYVDRWAIVVGISNYQDESINLKYAHRDAEELYRLIQTPSGGGFEEDHIVKLIDEEATTANITRALRSFLKKPAEQDIVLIYFACHGAPDRDRPDIIYLLTHDTDPDDISGTALPMREIDLSLKENLLAERVIIIADTCHSAALGGKIGRRSSGNDSAEVNRYFSEISKSQEGIALLTSAAAAQTAQESEKWGDGHGVFTYYLLEGMRGAADTDKNGVVSVGELFDYVSAKVKEATNNQQHPTVGTNSFDPTLPVAITGGADARELYRLGCHLQKMGAILGDSGRFISAARQFHNAIRLARLNKESFPKAQLQLGRSLLALRDYGGAIKSLQVIKEGEDVAIGFYHLGIAYIKNEEYAKAVQAFKTFCHLKPDHAMRPLIAEYISFLDTPPRKFALLIGLDEVKARMPNGVIWSHLAGVKNDLALLKEVLLAHHGFQPEHIIILSGQTATRQAIIDAFGRLHNQIKPFDTLIVHISGHSYNNQTTDYLLPSYDCDENEIPSIAGDELHQLLNIIPTRQKVVCLDTCGTRPNQSSTNFLKLVKAYGTYTLMMGASSNESGYESSYSSKVKNGAFSYHLAQQLRDCDLENVDWNDIATAVAKKVTMQFGRQHPFILQSLKRNTELADRYLWLLDFVERQHYLSFELDELRIRYERLDQTAKSIPQIHLCFGHAFFQHAAYFDAISAFHLASTLSGKLSSDDQLILGQAHFYVEQNELAIAALRQWGNATKFPTLKTQQREVIDLFENLKAYGLHALLIGIDDYLSPDIDSGKGAAEDVEKLKTVLSAQYGAKDENITVLCNEVATYQAILDGFHQLFVQASDVPALFYFAGRGSISQQGTPTIVSTDGRQPNVFDIDLVELATLVPDTTNLITVIDASWGRKSTRRRPTLGTDRRAPVRSRALKMRPTRAVQLEPLSDYEPDIGRLSIFHPSLNDPMNDDRNVMRYGLTAHFINRLQAFDAVTLRYADLLQWEGEVRPKTVSRNINPTNKIISREVPRAKIAARLRKLMHAPLAIEIIPLLNRVIERRNSHYPAGFLDLGIAYLLKGDYRQGIRALEKAIDQQWEKQLDEPIEAEMHYYLGRALFESERDFSRAVSELRLATQQNPDNTAAHYYLAEAIRALVERETLVEVERAYQTYLEQGATIGKRKEVQAFLNTRHNSEKVTDLAL